VCGPRSEHSAVGRERPLIERFTAAEFFAGIGFVRLGLEQVGFKVVFANDVDERKEILYAANFGLNDLALEDIRRITGGDVPDVDLATASFPCTDVSLAGWRKGLDGEQSGMFWEFARVLREMGSRKPRVVMLENVPSLASSRDGDDLRRVIAELNDLGYSCDLLELDARWWVPQSRPRVFIVGGVVAPGIKGSWGPNKMRPAWIKGFVARYPGLRVIPCRLEEPRESGESMEAVLDEYGTGDSIWWDATRLSGFVGELSPVQAGRLESLRSSRSRTWRTAYRRTRGGKTQWEIRKDEISGCLRAVRGGSSRQAVVEAGCGEVQVRWMTSREYARLMGAPSYKLVGVSENFALFALGDAVCVPAVEWLGENYLRPLCEANRAAQEIVAVSSGV